VTKRKRFTKNSLVRIRQNKTLILTTNIARFESRTGYKGFE